ncbi:MAG: ATP-binding protein [Verrucomicrobiota bacterium]|nr:ATP-binding protein [Verrucomicrobiota bacterium]
MQLGLGLAVFRANPRSYANQSFFLISLILSGWLVSLHFAFSATQPAAAAMWIRSASACGPLIVTGFNLLRLAIICRGKGWLEIAKRSAPLAIPSLPVIAICYSPLFLRYAQLRNGQIPRPVYGPFLSIWLGFFAIAAIADIALYIRDSRRATGVQKVELQFVLAGGAILVALVACTPLVDRTIAVRFAPFRVVVFSLVIAYGISTRKIMEVGSFFRRVTSYAVLIAYLLALYGFVWWVVFTSCSPILKAQSAQVAHIAAALVLALAMAPARGLSQSLANRLFVGTRGLDFRETMNQAAAILKSVTTVSDLLGRFAKTIGAAVGTERVLILLAEKDVFSQSYPAPPTSSRDAAVNLSSAEATISHLAAHQEPIVLDELHRVRQTPELDGVMKQMKSLNVALAMGIFSREHLVGVMLLGPRVSGRIYGSVEQSALQVLCGQLAVAIQNAELFTEVQNAKIYNETLLANLTTGVIAAGADERVTVFNNEAGQITELDPQRMIDRPLADLPPGLRDIVRETLRSGAGAENSEITLRSGERTLIVRASSSLFHSENGRRLGALVVLTDITALKRLEQQIRRSDRLASLGTLSAGMAHEIKNPLVSIKTFAQLLPERYQDSDFRETFSNLIGHEIDRIDSLVNQLLRFARPAKPLLKPMHVHDVLEKSLQLVGHRLYQEQIKLARSWEADVDTIRADADQIEQVFLNFFLNAMDAMKKGGELTVATEILRADEWVRSVAGTNGDGDVKEVLRITIRDNGEGIRSEDIPHVFDPFFTTKDYGTGLGLSVVHGIIEEHGGQIEVESELEKGTAFHILMPLFRFQEKAVAA